MNPQQPPYGEDREPWDEHEMVQLAVEMFRQRDRMLSPQTPRFPAAQILFESLSNEAVQPPWQPNWDELVLPKGRTVSSCRHIYNNFQRRSSGPNSGRSFAQGPTSYSMSASQPPSRKRSLPSEAPTPIIGRPLAPKQPATFPADTRALLTGHHAQHPPSPLGEPAPGVTEPRKKRGRPTKKEQEERRRKVESKNQTQHSPALTSPYGPQLQRISTPVLGENTTTLIGGGPIAPTPVLATPRTLPPEAETNSSSSSGKKRRGRPPKLPSQSDQEPLTQPSFIAPNQQASSAYGSPPVSASFSASTRERRTSISTRSTGAAPGPLQQDQGEDSEESRRRQRSWNDTVMGTSNPRQP